MCGPICVADITAAAKAGDCAGLARMIAKVEQFGKLLCDVNRHPLLVAATADVAMLLLPFTRQRVLLSAIHDALYLRPARVDVARALIEQGRSRLGRAIQDGHIWLDQYDGGTSALHVAACFDCVKILPSLLALRPNLEAKGRHNTSALGLAVERGHIRMVKALLAAGADPDPGIERIRDTEESKAIAPLLIAAGARTTANVGRLLKLQPRDEWHRVIAQAAPASAWPHEQVRIAFEVLDSQFAEMLLKAGAESAAATIGALQNADSNLLPLVVSTPKAISRRALRDLVMRPDALKAALADGLDVNARDEAGHILLTLAAVRLAYALPSERRRICHSIDILLTAGADRSGRLGRSSPLRSFLDLASSSRSYSLRWLLLRGLRDPLAVHHYLRPGMYPSDRILRILLHFSPSPNVRDILGRTPLHMLASNTDIHDAYDHLEVLLKAGADPTLTDKQNQTPLDIALRLKRNTIITTLQAERRTREANAMRESVAVYRSTPKARTMRL